ncbi:transcription elongation factor B polypeptide 3-like [Oppia nitens]|uniref:transcription elongation factor B polypeptide 3-like n=1 Tax=Oppia nitens TaxID=1686743 RepID=UPI0023DA4767|nr:transcription elongation factor B polypeptide 3-like [Oppia nitens]
MSKYVDTVQHLKKKLDKGVSYDKTLHILHKLQKIPVTIDLLAQTGIGKTVRTLSKEHSGGDNDIGKTAKLLCYTWKAAVKEEQHREQQSSGGEDDDNNDEEEEEDDDDEDARSDRYDNDVVGDDVKDDDIIDTNNYDDDDDDDDEEDRRSPPPPTPSPPPPETTSKSSSKSKRSHSDDRNSERKRKKHKSSSSHRKSESNDRSKTEFETLLGLNDEISIRNHKKSRKSDSSDHHKQHNHKSHHNNNKHIKREVIDETVSSPVKNGRTKDYYSPVKVKHERKSMDSMDIISSLPVADYKPLPNKQVIDERVEANRRNHNKQSPVKANTGNPLSYNVSSKKGRTAVFAGNARTKIITHVATLENLCVDVLSDNYDHIYDMPVIETKLLQKLLKKCTVRQLSRLERLNPHIMDETDGFWKEICKKEFKGCERRSSRESWRDLYIRCGEERETKLKNITKFISRKQEKAVPVRQTQFSENVKTPREILRKQEKSGFVRPIAGSSGGGGGGSSGGGYSSNHLVKIVPEKPKVAPLMKKVLQMSRARVRR